MKNGVLDQASHEINEKPDSNDQNTCNLNTFNDLSSKLKEKERLQKVTRNNEINLEKEKTRRILTEKIKTRESYEKTVFSGLFCISPHTFVVQNTPNLIQNTRTKSIDNTQKESIFKGMFLIGNC